MENTFLVIVRDNWMFRSMKSSGDDPDKCRVRLRTKLVLSSNDEVLTRTRVGDMTTRDSRVREELVEFPTEHRYRGRKGEGTRACGLGNLHGEFVKVSVGEER